ncbi:MAG TPA: PxKF domain-containing protein [Pyrinomonadaceae bacterium]|nr:PxKF domain-containing protein [Pyrinomonadaceae bacterium]
MRHAPRFGLTRRTRTLASLFLFAALAAIPLLSNFGARAARFTPADGAFVATDQTDYKPGDTVVIFGSGWAGGETVKLNVHADSSERADAELSAKADEYGNILNKEFSPTDADLGASFTLTATGETSGRTATAKFTDGGNVVYSPSGVALSAVSGTNGSTTAVFNVSVTMPAGNGNIQPGTTFTGTGGNPFTNAWTVTSTASPNGPFNTGNNINGQAATKTFTVSVTPPANTAPGIYTGTVKANAPNSVASNPGVAVQVTVTADNLPPTTTLSAVDASNNPYNGAAFINTAKVTITLSAADNSGGSGVAVTRYKVDNGPFKNYTGPFDISNEGLSVVTYFSEDNTGAQETAQFFFVKIDRTAPAINCGTADGVWHNADVNIACTAADDGGQQKAGLANPADASFSLSTNVPAGTEDANASTGTHQVCDNAGNCATAGPVAGNKVDKKAPDINCGTASAAWLSVDAVIPCTASDGGSGTSTTSFSLFTSVPAGTEDANASTNSQQVCDAVGNCATAGPVSGNKVDKKAPTITCASDDGSWHGSNVTLNCTASDAGSGLANPSDATFTLTTNVAAGTETSNASTGSRTVADAVGNSSSVGPYTGIKVDLKAPSTSCGAADGNWHPDNVSIGCTASDGGSGLANASDASFSLSTSVADGADDANASTGTHAVCDGVNNCTTAGPIAGNKIDRKAPSVSASAAKADSSAYNAGDWTNQDVTVSYSCDDGTGSGVASVDAPDTLSAEGANQSATGQCTDNVGHTASATFQPVNIDKTKPTLSFDSYSPAPNGAGWNNTNVSVAFTPADALSGVASTSTASPLVLSNEGSSVTGSVTVTDVAGNSETFTTSPVKIDKTKPTLAPARHAGSEANGAGWNKTDVTVDANASDALSGVANVSPNASQTVSTEGANQSVSFTATDAAGNSETASLGGINIDKTAPAVTAKRNPLANSFGWNNTDVTVSVDTATDALSGVATTSAPVTVSTEGFNQSATVSATDVAGNTGSATVNNINIDKTAPSATITSPNAGPYMLNQTVAASYNCSDGGNTPSGIDTCTGTVANGAGVNTSSVGSHTFSVTATDKAGNTASKSVTYGVVYDWSGFLQPINVDGTSVFKLGSTVPVKFRLVGGSASVVNATNFTLWVAKVSNNIVGSEVEALTSTAASTGNLFRYDPTGGIYIYNMGTKGAPWTAGTWQLRVDLGDGAPPRTVLISLKP